MHVIWRGLHPERTSLEHLELDPWTRARGTVTETGDSTGYAAHYDLTLDPAGFPQAVDLSFSDGRRLGLRRSVDGEWTRESGEPLPEFTGCTDLDLSATPLTNTLPLRRLGLAVGEGAVIEAVWVGLPEFTLRRVRQRYIRLGERTYRYENLESGYRNEVTVDEHGLVVLYPGAFERVELE